ncbi:conserved hypothetical protein [Mesorhizobium plurifarium]|uniref:Uncharacterized protein n=1 Tax=Mesorhizobium plurifarium TaxID=69974 RepID=A0A0K2VYL8_MESPL|nr:conserved hypothetical protein [Mesorhizobium plurifarium]
MDNFAEPDFDTVTRLPPADVSTGDDDLDSARVEARQYLEFYNWVLSVKGEYFGYGAEGIIYIFLFEIEPGRPEVNRWIWAIVGDVPPAFLPADDAATPFEVLDGYIGALEEWVEAAREGKSVAELISVNVDATLANAEMLAGRLKFLDERILPELKGN